MKVTKLFTDIFMTVSQRLSLVVFGYFVFALRPFLKKLLLVTEKASTSGVRDVTWAIKNALLSWFSPSLTQVMINSLMVSHKINVHLILQSYCKVSTVRNRPLLIFSVILAITRRSPPPQDVSPLVVSPFFSTLVVLHPIPLSLRSQYHFLPSSFASKYFYLS